MENTFEVLSMEEMSMSQLELLKDSIEEEIASRQKKKEREEAISKIYNLLETIQELCTKYNIDLYDGRDNLFDPYEITI